jgi:N-acetylglucosamine-6-sulfatase
VTVQEGSHTGFRLLLLLFSMALALALLWGAFSGSEPGSEPVAAKTSPRPNFVFILTDDMRKDELKYMPKTRALLKTKGRQFENAFVSNPLCCPSRATIMRGQYAHNTRVWFNSDSSLGGWQAYKSRGYEKNNVATHLHGAGYRTGLFGKYFNSYDGTTVPPGWDHWFGFVGNGDYFDYDVNVNGNMQHRGNSKNAYSTDVLSRQTQSFIATSVRAGKPFFAYVSPKAPHNKLVPAPRDVHTYDGKKAPRPPSFNEKDVSDKPRWIEKQPKLTPTQIADIDDKYEARLETLQAADDLVNAVVNKLRRAGVLGNTYVVFTSDNGMQLGEHRISHGKGRPYEESVHMPLLVRGPGVPEGSTTDKLVLNTDFLPTFTDLAGTTTPRYVDGRSLRRVLTGSAKTWRTAILLEGRRSGDQPGVLNRKNYYGIVRRDRSGTTKYLEYESGNEELYRLGGDPYEMSSTHKSSSATSLHTRLQALKSCARDSCRKAENGP